MFTLESSHFVSLLIALIFSLLVHFSLTGFANSLQTFFIGFAIFPVVLMTLTLFVPQDFLQVTSYLLILSGFSLAIYKTPKRIKDYSKTFSKMESKEKWIIAAVIIYLLSFFMSATIFRDGGSIQDALVYHLEGPKEWTLFLNGAKFNPNNPITFTTSYYDYYYYFLFLLVKPLFIYTAPLATTHNEFLSYTMLLAAQTFTGIVALFYIPLLILRFSSSLGLYKYLVIFFIFGIRLFTWSWVLPKNDAYSFLCFLLGVELFYRHYIIKNDNNSAFFLFLSALIIGIGTASKLTNAYVVIFSLFFLISFYYRDVLVFVNKIGLLKAIGVVSIGLGIGVSIFLLRNFLNTGNPFYPIAKFGFPNIYLSDYADRPEKYTDPVSWAGAMLKMKVHLLGFPQLLLLLILGFFTRARLLSFFYICMVAFMSKQTGSHFNFRMTTIYLLLDLILFILIFHQLDLVTKFKRQKPYSYLFIFIVLIFANIQVEKLIKYPLKFYPQTSGETIKGRHDYWDILLQTNLDHRNNPKYIFSPSQEIFPYFSRFPMISQYDSVPEFRYDYYKK